MKTLFRVLWLIVKTVGIVAAGGWLGYQAGLFFGLSFPWLLIPILFGMGGGGYIALNL